MMGITEREAQDLARSYDRAVPEARATMHRAMRLAEERGWVRTVLGRRARFPDGKRLHKALNNAVQGSAADVNKVKLVELYHERRRLGLVMRLTVHDEFVGDVPDAATAREVASLLDVQSTPMDVPILWDTRTGCNWREAVK